MNTIDNYLHQKNLLLKFRTWASLNGKPYGGGVGLGQSFELGSVCKATGTLTIYHQAYDGAKNYHEIEKDYIPYLDDAIKHHSSVLIKYIEEQLLKEVEKARQKALNLAQEIVKY